MVIAGFLLLACGWIAYRTTRTPGLIQEIRNPSGHPLATVAYQPGLGSFPREVAQAFGKGLADAGWQVRLTTVHPSAAPGAAASELLVLVSPIYWGAPGRPVRRFVNGLGQLRGHPVVIVLTGMGTPGHAPADLAAWVTRGGGRVERSLVFYTMRPNDEAHYRAGRNRADGLRLAEAAAADIARGRP
jgi:hypothetical protein